MRESEFQSVSLGDAPEQVADTEWIEKELATFWAFAAENFRESGRGVIALGLHRTDLRATAAQIFPMLYVPSKEKNDWHWRNEEQLVSMVEDYDPNREFILVLMKQNWERVIRAGVVSDDSALGGK